MLWDIVSSTGFLDSRALLVPAFPVWTQTKTTFTELAFYTNDAQAFAGILSAGVALIASLCRL